MSAHEAQFKGRVVHAVKWSTVQVVVQNGASLLVIVVLARLLDPTDFGLVNLASVAVMLTSVLVTQGFGEALIQRPAVDERTLSTAFWVNLFFAVLCVGAMLGTADWFADFFENERLAPVLRWLSLGFLLRALVTVQTALLRRELRFRDLAVRTSVSESVGAAVGVGCALAGAGVWSLVAMQLSASVAACVTLWRVSAWRPRREFSWTDYRSLFAFGSNIMGINLVGFFYRRLPDLLIGRFMGVHAVGLFGFASNLVQRLLQALTGIVANVALPAFAKVQHDTARMRRGYFFATEWAAVTGFPVFIGLAWLADPLVRTVFSEKWAQAIPLLQVLAVLGVRDCLVFLDNQLLTALGKPQWRLGLSIAHTVMNALGIILGMDHGLVGIAIGLAVAAALYWPMSVWCVHRQLPFQWGDFFARYRSAALAVLAMLAVLAAWRAVLGPAWLAAHPVVYLVTTVLLGAAAYLLTVRLCAPGLWQRAREMLGPRHGLPQQTG